MKKAGILLFLAMFSLVALPQKVKVRKIRKLPVEQKLWFPVFGDDNNEILVTGQNYNGLYLYDIRKKNLKVITEANGSGSGFEKEDNGDIIFREAEFRNGKKTINYRKFDASTGLITESKPVIPTGTSIKVSGKSIEIREGENLKTSIIPIQDKFLIWASLSPDKTKILFTAAGDGSYICDLDGKILYSLGYLNAPVWVNQEWIMGMNDKDDGEKVLSSDIIAIHLASGEKTNLTKKFKGIAQYPKVSPDGDRLTFNNPEGDIYLVRMKLSSR